MKVYPQQFCKSLLWNRTKITFAGMVLSRPGQTSHLGNINLNIQYKEFILVSGAGFRQMIVQFMDNLWDRKSQWWQWWEKNLSMAEKLQALFSWELKQMQLANFPSDVLTNNIIWFPMTVIVLRPVAKAEWAASPPGHLNENCTGVTIVSQLSGGFYIKRQCTQVKNNMSLNTSQTNKLNTACFKKRPRLATTLSVSHARCVSTINAKRQRSAVNNTGDLKSTAMLVAL